MTYPIAQLERRFLAFALDRLIGWAVIALVGAITWRFVSSQPWIVGGVSAGAVAVVWLVLSIVVGVSGNSPGKAACGLRVVHHGSGTPVGVGPALARSLVLSVSGLPTFGLGIATLAWTAVEDRGRQRRGWHDHLTHTVVVDVRPVMVETQVEADAGPRHIVNLTAMRLIPAPAVEVPRTPERSEHSMRRQPLPAEMLAPPLTPPLTPSTRWPTPSAQIVPPPPAPAPVPTPIPTPTPAPSSFPGPAVGSMRWRAHFDNGESFVIVGMALVGRRPEPRHGEHVAHLVPLTSADMSVSKTHAQFGPAADGTIVVMDRGSTNGTLLVRRGVSRHLAPGKPAALLDGDKVIYGDREMFLTREP